MRLGKLTACEIEKILGKLSKSRKEVLLSGGVGEDCAVLQCEDFVLVTSDPITWDTKNLGALSIHISANDVYAGGGEPFAASITLIATPETEVSELEKIMDEADETAKSLGIDIIGGHTEFSDSVRRTISCVTMLGRTKKPVYTRSVKPGDALFMTKFAGLEGTLILGDRQELLSEISVRREAEILAGFQISAMHDVTEGGVLGAAREMCAGRERLDLDKIPVLPETKKLCEAKNLNPHTLIGSGSMLVAADEKTAMEAIKKLRENGINATKIGEVL